jgi:hypothetical protein
VRLRRPAHNKPRYGRNNITKNISPKPMQFVVACRRIEVQIDWLISNTIAEATPRRKLATITLRLS